jgi:hypothetical protein
LELRYGGALFPHRSEAAPSACSLSLFFVLFFPFLLLLSAYLARSVFHPCCAVWLSAPSALLPELHYLYLSPRAIPQLPQPPTYTFLVALFLVGMAKKRKLSSEHPPVEEAHDTPPKRAEPTPPESGLATVSKSIRGVISRVTGSGNDFEVSPVVNGASPAPRHFLSKLLSDVKSQGGRFTENFGLLASLAETKLFAGGLADDRKYQVGATRLSHTQLPCFEFRATGSSPTN